MCILFFYANSNPVPNGYKLVLVNNRDEFYKRPTKAAHFWECNPDIIGGMDMEPGKEGGTWLAMSKSGKIGVLLNILEPVGSSAENKQGRGFLVPNFLSSFEDGPNYLRQIKSKSSDFNSFNMVTIELQNRPVDNINITHYSNLSLDEPHVLPNGEYGFGNSQPESPWQKVVFGKKKFSEIISNHPTKLKSNLLIGDLIEFLNDGMSHYPDPQLQSQAKGRPEEAVKSLSALNVKIPSIQYGTRTNIIILVDDLDNATFVERTMKEPIYSNDPEWTTQIYKFKLT